MLEIGFDASTCVIYMSRDYGVITFGVVLQTMVSGYKIDIDWRVDALLSDYIADQSRLPDFGDLNCDCRF